MILNHIKILKRIILFSLIIILNGCSILETSGIITPSSKKPGNRRFPTENYSILQQAQNSSNTNYFENSPKKNYPEELKVTNTLQTKGSIKEYIEKYNLYVKRRPEQNICMLPSEQITETYKTIDDNIQNKSMNLNNETEQKILRNNNNSEPRKQSNSKIVYEYNNPMWQKHMENTNTKNLSIKSSKSYHASNNSEKQNIVVDTNVINLDSTSMSKIDAITKHGKAKIKKSNHNLKQQISNSAISSHNSHMLSSTQEKQLDQHNEHTNTKKTVKMSHYNINTNSQKQYLEKDHHDENQILILTSRFPELMLSLMPTKSMTDQPSQLKTIFDIMKNFHNNASSMISSLLNRN